VLDEPTNDLDVETLEALESRLRQYAGTLIVVSHDRHFLDAIVTRTLVFEADGAVHAYPGGYSDWVRKHRELAAGEDGRTEGSARPEPKRRPASAKPAKLSYKLKRELEALPDAIDRLETELMRLNEEIAKPEFYKQDHGKTRARLDALESLERELETSLDRWAELEQLQSDQGS
jgi:ATP-binding cassette subfamily F protein uup